jgi:hypothetical protein
MKEIFLGRRELFKGLWIDSSDYDWAPHPVIHLDFSTLTSDNVEELKADMTTAIRAIAISEKIEIDGITPPAMIMSLLKSLADKYERKVVVLIDEYDAPILDEIANADQADKNRKILKTFYSVFKSYDKYLRFVFLTGVTNFSQTSLFSGANHFIDISLAPDYVNICGFTHDDFDGLFSDRLPEVLDYFKTEAVLSKEATIDDLKSKIMAFYDGYSWDGETRVLNPWSILNFFIEKEFGAFWCRTGSPAFLTLSMQSDPAGYSAFKDGNVINKNLNKIDIGDLAPIPLMFQTGYLTVSEIKWLNDVRHFILKTPNGEVLSSLLSLLTYSAVDSSKLDELKRLATDLRDAFSRADASSLEQAFHNLLSFMPNSMHSSYEGYYQTVFFLALNSINQSVELKKSTGDGTFDAIVKIGADVFVIEFKCVKSWEEEEREESDAADAQEKKNAQKPPKKKLLTAQLNEKLAKSVQEAMDQIEEKNYAAMFLSSEPPYRVFKTAVAVAGRTSVKAFFKEIER